MGAFETFVNANLGIRKPLILDLGHPSGSNNAAGVIGSEYVDTSNNFLYEKTGENNLSDWVYTRKLGDSSLETLEAINSTGVVLQGQIQDLSEASLSYSIVIPSGVSNMYVKYADIDGPNSYTGRPDIASSLRFSGSTPPESYYSHMLYAADQFGFSVSFSSDIDNGDLFLDVIIKGSPDS